MKRPSVPLYWRGPRGIPTNPTAREFASIVVIQLSSILKDDTLRYLHLEAERLKKNYTDMKDGKSSKWTSEPVPGLRAAYDSDFVSGVMSQLKFHLQGIHAHRNLTKTNEKDQMEVSDLSYPTEWYPETRKMQRTVHLHVGPTNSGKTYHALQRLEQAESGIYAGPLRLLAYEVYTRLNAKGIKCDLVTGDEMQMSDDGEGHMTSCTVEMVPQGRGVDVAVIDEIQMLGNKQRGWAWTQALLGVRAKEVHVCGEERAVPLLRELAVSMGDKLEVHHYKRLSPLRAMSSSLEGDLGNLRKGDCVICFSKRDLHAMKNQIENKTKRNVAIVYGSLPPESRAHQARLFNDPNNDYDYLVATDAIGMGLNLSIKRIIFDTTYKFNGRTHERISVPDLKQIAGRAGRYRVAPQHATSPDVIAPDAEKVVDPLDDIAAEVRNRRLEPSAEKPALVSKTKGDSDAVTTGFVTSLEKINLPHVQEALTEEAEPIMAAGIMPPDSVVVPFAAYFPPDTAFSYILHRLHELCQTKPRYFLCDLKDTLRIAQALDSIPQLTITDRLTFCAAPTNAGTPESDRMIQALARCVAENKSGALLDIPELNLELLDTPDSIANSDILTRFESLHKSLVLYTWLSYRFVGVFVSRAMAFHVKELVEARINKLLSDTGLAEKRRKSKLKAMRLMAKMEEHDQKREKSVEAAALVQGQADNLEDRSVDLGETPSLRDVSVREVTDLGLTTNGGSDPGDPHHPGEESNRRLDVEAIDLVATETEFIPDKYLTRQPDTVEDNTWFPEYLNEEDTMTLHQYDGDLAGEANGILSRGAETAVNSPTVSLPSESDMVTGNTLSPEETKVPSVIDGMPKNVLQEESCNASTELEVSEEPEKNSASEPEPHVISIKGPESSRAAPLPRLSPPSAATSEWSEQLS